MKTENREYHQEDCSGAISVSAFERFMDYTEEEDRQILFDHIIQVTFQKASLFPGL